MNFLKQLILFTLLFVPFNLLAQERYTISPERPVNGARVLITYDPSGTKLAGQKNIHAVIYNYQQYKWAAEDLPLKFSNNKWQTSYNIPENSGFIALKFMADTLTDNNGDQGYFTMVQDKDRPGKLAPGAYAGWGLARSPAYQMDIPNYIKFKGITDSATYHWVSQEISNNTAARSVLVYPYAMSAKKTFKKDAVPTLEKVMVYLTRTDATEADLLNARKILTNVIMDPKATDSLNKMIMLRYPKGSLARLAAIKAIPAGSDPAITVAGIEKFLMQFPEDSSTAEFDKENRISYPGLYQSLIILKNFVNKNYDEFNKRIDNLPLINVINVYYKIVEIPYSRKEVDDKTLLPISERIFKRLESLRNSRPDDYKYMSPSEWDAYLNSLMNRNIPIHMHLLSSAGRYQESISYGEPLIDQIGYKNAVLNAEMAYSLEKLNRSGALKELLEKSVFANQSSPEMLSALKKDYIKVHGSDQGYPDYLAKLKNSVGEEQMTKSIEKEMINVPMVDFSMKDLDGKTVRLADLKGKTVVLDFWATWCVPCKASFPGMKLALERYANNSNVAFYFVDTEERGDNYKTEVKKYLKDNDFPFQVLFDNKVTSGKATGEVFERVCKAFQISGIPQKIILGADGKAKFISVGYKGSATELADEISAMVELSRNKK